MVAWLRGQNVVSAGGHPDDALPRKCRRRPRKTCPVGAPVCRIKQTGRRVASELVALITLERAPTAVGRRTEAGDDRISAVVGRIQSEACDRKRRGIACYRGPGSAAICRFPNPPVRRLSSPALLSRWRWSFQPPETMRHGRFRCRRSAAAWRTGQRRTSRRRFRRW